MRRQLGARLFVKLTVTGAAPPSGAIETVTFASSFPSPEREPWVAGSGVAIGYLRSGSSRGEDHAINVCLRKAIGPSSHTQVNGVARFRHERARTEQESRTFGYCRALVTTAVY